MKQLSLIIMLMFSLPVYAHHNEFFVSEWLHQTAHVQIIELLVLIAVVVVFYMFFLKPKKNKKL